MTSMDVPVNYKEILFMYGRKNNAQIFGGSNIVIPKTSLAAHVIYAPVIVGKTISTDMLGGSVYIYVWSGITIINYTNDTIRYAVFYR